MNRSDLEQKLEDIEIELARQGVVLTARPYEAHRSILAQEGINSAPLYSRPGTPPTLFEQIDQWYEARYGAHMLVDAKVGEMPFMLRGLVYFFRFPVAMGRVHIDILGCIEGLTDHMTRSLAKPEIKDPNEIEGLEKEYKALESSDQGNEKKSAAGSTSS